MKKLLFVSAVAFFAFTSASAQSSESTSSKFKIGAGLNVLFPVSNADAYSVGVGVDVMAQYAVSENISITADAGYTSLMVKSEFKSDDFKSQGIIPIRAGIRFFPSSQFYIGGKVGVGIMTDVVKSINLVTGEISKGSQSTTAYSFGAGYMLSPKLDIGINYDGYSKNGSLGLIGARLGYTFGN